MERVLTTYHSDHCGGRVTVATDSATTADSGLLCWQARGRADPGHTRGRNTHTGEHTHKLIYANTQRCTHSHFLSQVQSSPLVVLHSTNSTGPLADVRS